MNLFIKQFAIGLVAASIFTGTLVQANNSTEEWNAAVPFKEFHNNLNKGIELASKTQITTKFQVYGKLAPQTQIYASIQGAPKYELINPSLPPSLENIRFENEEKCTQEFEYAPGQKMKMPVEKNLVVTSTGGVDGSYAINIPTSFVQDGCPAVTQNVTFYLKYNFNPAEIEQMISRLKKISPVDYVSLYEIHYAGLDPASDGTGFVSLTLMPPVADEYTLPMLDPSLTIDAKLYSPEGRHSLHWFNPKFPESPKQFVAYYSFSQQTIDGKKIQLNVMNAGKAPAQK